ncbi:response regulator [Roseateles saccharophilus]|uniref:CheY-like chemotaxis protein n=1 Tax=Roseateles saccharophilus TaxID=304 RepID=A0A4R3UK20_ROSSA|nr:response regulator [Roseateles saccharophilus]MDG0835128.1 response regulator [Roseateles saccharophilus]TCU89717.1 CheY-like chemotaxis protein [Roseateles saccharophilus]
MFLMDDTIQAASALIIDSNANSRSLMSAQLRDLGVGTVRQTPRVKDARVMLEHQTFDIVLCDYHFDAGDTSGQDLLDELRREGLLPYSTVFVMVTSEATYAKVAEAAEAALDAYLIKPYTSANLAERLASARQRKRILKDIFEAVENQDFETAANLCLVRFEAKGRYWLYAARIGAELLLRLKRYDDARTLYEAIITAKTLPWARLGVARTEVASGNLQAARRTLENLIGELPDYADSHDLMGHVQMEQGDLPNALKTYQTAVTLTPGCLLRLQRCGSLGFYAGQRAEALKLLERAMSQGLRSKLFDVLSLVLIGLMRFDAKDFKGFKYAHDSLIAALERAPRSSRLRRFDLVFRGLAFLMERRVGQALVVAREFTEHADAGDFDLEAASLLTALWIRLSSQEVELEEMMPILRELGMRHCATKAGTEILVAMAENHQGAAEQFRDCHQQVFNVAETAMRYSLRGGAKAAVELLIHQGEITRNAKLIDMAGLVLKRHADKIDDAAELSQRIEVLHSRYVKPMAGSPAKAGRATGGVALRTAATAPA